MKDVIVRKFHNTDIPQMTIFIERNLDSLGGETFDWINAEIANLPFDEYIKNACRGIAMRSCFIARHKNWMKNQCLVLKDTIPGKGTVSAG